MQPDNEPSRLFNNTDALLGQVHIAVIRLDDKVTNLADKFETFSKAVRDDLKDHEERIRTLEGRDYVSPQTVWKVIAAMMTFLGLVVSAIGVFWR